MRVLKRIPLVLVFLLLTTCTNGPRSPSTEEVEQSLPTLFRAQRDALEEASRHVFVDAFDIELPPMGTGEAPPPDHTYVFHVYVDDPKGRPLESIMGTEFFVDVLGSKNAKVEIVNYGVPNANGHVPEHLISRKNLRVTLDSSGLTSDVTVVAWFREEYQRHEIARSQRLARIQEQIDIAKNDVTKRDLLQQYRATRERPNPHGEVSRIRVFNGDLHTRIFLASEEEVCDAFGSEFAKYFYVGRVYFKNRHNDKKLIINTTSIRARTLFYREPNPELAARFLADGSDGQLVLEKLEQRFGGGSTGIGLTTPTGLTPWQLDELFQGIRANLSRIYLANPDQLPNLLSEVVKSAIPEATAEQQVEARTLALDYFSECSKLFEKLAAGRNEQDKNRLFDLFTMSRAERSSAAQPNDGPSIDVINRGFDELSAQARAIIQGALRTSPISQRVPILVGATGKPGIFSRNVRRDLEFAATGYLFEDYYRPMTFEAVLTSLLKKYEQNPVNQLLTTLGTAAQIAGGLVGLSSISSSFRSDVFADSVAFAASIVIPSLRELLIEKLDVYLENLGSLALGTQFTLGPNEVRDGYVFFPRVPIYGFGIDAFSPDQPSFIVNIDNVDVAVDGSLVARDFEFTSGARSPSSLIELARNRGQSKENQREKEVADLLESIRKYRLSNLTVDAEKLIADGKPDEAKALTAAFEKLYGRDMTGIVDRIKADADAKKSDQSARAGGGVSIRAADGVQEIKQLTIRESVLPTPGSSVASKGRYSVVLKGKINGESRTRVLVVPTSTAIGFRVFDAKGEKLLWPEKGAAPSVTLEFVNETKGTEGTLVHATSDAFVIEVVVSRDVTSSSELQAAITHSERRDDMEIGRTQLSVVVQPLFDYEKTAFEALESARTAANVATINGAESSSALKSAVDEFDDTTGKPRSLDEVKDHSKKFDSAFSEVKSQAMNAEKAVASVEQAAHEARKRLTEATGATLEAIMVLDAAEKNVSLIAATVAAHAGEVKEVARPWIHGGAKTALEAGLDYFVKAEVITSRLEASKAEAEALRTPESSGVLINGMVDETKLKEFVDALEDMIKKWEGLVPNLKNIQTEFETRHKDQSSKLAVAKSSSEAFLTEAKIVGAMSAVEVEAARSAKSAAESAQSEATTALDAQRQTTMKVIGSDAPEEEKQKASADLVKAEQRLAAAKAAFELAGMVLTRKEERSAHLIDLVRTAERLRLIVPKWLLLLDVDVATASAIRDASTRFDAMREDVRTTIKNWSEKRASEAQIKRAEAILSRWENASK